MYQDTTLASSINAFSPSVTIPAALLQSLQDGLQALQEEVAALRSERDQDREEIAALRRSVASTEKQQDTLADNQLIQLRLIREVKEESHKEPSITKKTTNHIDQLHKLMLEDRSQQVSIAKGARLLGISKERLRQLKPLILKDGRFEMGWSTMKGQKGSVIRIRQYLKGTKF